MTKNKQNIFSVSGCLSMEEMMDYIHDRLSMKDRNQVERHLQQCELCEEAMEGFSLLKGQEGKVKSIVGDINKGLIPADHKIRWMAAASVALAILAGGIMYLNYQLNPHVEPTQVSVVQDSNKLKKSVSIPQGFVEKDSSPRVFKQQFPEENQLSLNPSNGINKDIPKQEENSNAFLAPSSVKTTQEEKEFSTNKPIVNSGNAAGNVMADSIYYNPAPAVELSESKIREDEKVAVVSRSMDVKRNYSSEEKRAKKKAVTPQYRSAPVGKSEYEADMLYDDANIPQKDKEVHKDGISSYHNKNYKEATLILEEVLKSVPDSAQALYYNGLSHFELKNYDKSLLNFDKIQKGDAHYEDAEQMKAKVYLANGNKNKAIEFLQQIIIRNGKYRIWAEEEMRKLNK